MRRIVHAQLLLAIGFSLIGSGRIAADELYEKLLFASQGWITNQFQNEQINTIAIGSFECVGKANNQANQASGGMEITRRLKQAFDENKFKVDIAAPVKIHGEYVLVQKGQTHQISISFVLTDTNTFKRIVKFSLDPVEIKRPDIIAKLTGLTGEIGGENPRLREAALTKIISSPSATVSKSGTIVKPSPDSEYGVEILVKNQETGLYSARATRVQGELAFIQLNKNDVYSIRLYNNSNEPAAVELLLDGLSAFAMNEDESLRQARYIIYAGESTEIRGWTINNEQDGANEFKIGVVNDSIAAQKLPRERVKIGLISATFARAWDASNPPPDVRKRPVIKDAQPDVANVLGNKITERLQRVNYDFAFPKAVVSIRYSDAPPIDLPQK